MHEDSIADQIDLMLESIELIENRFSKIQQSEDFVSSSDGVTLLDAVSMRLQVIGESVRKIQKLEPSFLNRYQTIDWDKLARFRDLVSHHYTRVDHEIVFDICKVHIPRLKDSLQQIRSGLPVRL
jgi:uncharacterized protein with HEPN domain